MCSIRSPEEESDHAAPTTTPTTPRPATTHQSRPFPTTAPTMRNPITGVIAIVCLTVLEIVAIQHQINGSLFSLVTAAIAGIAGYAVQPKPP